MVEQRRARLRSPHRRRRRCPPQQTRRPCVDQSVSRQGFAASRCRPCHAESRGDGRTAPILSSSRRRSIGPRSGIRASFRKYPKTKVPYISHMAGVAAISHVMDSPKHVVAGGCFTTYRGLRDSVRGAPRTVRRPVADSFVMSPRKTRRSRGKTVSGSISSTSREAVGGAGDHARRQDRQLPVDHRVRPVLWATPGRCSSAGATPRSIAFLELLDQGPRLPTPSDRRIQRRSSRSRG